MNPDFWAEELWWDYEWEEKRGQRRRGCALPIEKLSITASLPIGDDQVQ
jgi:hypothetical protein